MKHFLHPKRRLGLPALLLLMASLLAAGCIDDPEPHSLVGAGDLLPDFAVTLNDGSTLTADDLGGRVSLIVFFNTECADCRAELPVIQDFYNRHPEVLTLCIARSEDAADIALWWRENGLTLPWSPQPDAAVFNLFATSGIPRVYLVDPARRIAAAWDDSPIATLEDLEAALDRIEK